MVNFVVSVEFVFFDFVVSDYSGGNLIFCKADSAQGFANIDNVFRSLPIYLYPFFFEIAEKVFAIIRQH